MNFRWHCSPFLLAIGALGSPAVMAAAEAEYATQRWVDNSGIPLESQGYQSAVDQAQAGNHIGCQLGPCQLPGEAFAWAAARADATRLSQGLLTIAGSTQPQQVAAVRASTYLENSFVVQSASLPAGSLVSLTLSGALQGSLGARFPGTLNGEAAVGIVAGGTAPRPGMGEFEQPALVLGTASWHVMSTSYGLDGGLGWKLGLQRSYDASGYGPADYYGACAENDPLCLYERLRPGLDIGDNPLPLSATVAMPLDITFRAQVGARYTYFAYLATTYAEANGLTTLGSHTETVADFGHTLQVGLTPQQGTSLTWDVPLAPVPETAAWALWLLGLGVLGAGRLKAGKA